MVFQYMLPKSLNSFCYFYRAENWTPLRSYFWKFLRAILNIFECLWRSLFFAHVFLRNLNENWTGKFPVLMIVLTATIPDQLWWLLLMYYNYCHFMNTHFLWKHFPWVLYNFYCNLHNVQHYKPKRLQDCVY